MSKTLVISVRLHEGWYHGTGAIPSPARVFQGLVAGRGLSGPLPTETIAALEWLENQSAPTVAAPATKAGQSVVTYVPNNDLDAKQGDHRRIGEIRTKKTVWPQLFDPDVPFIYCWDLRDEVRDEPVLRHICELADGLYQLGRSVDPAWACADVLNDDEIFERLRSHRGPVYRPSAGKGNVECPAPGSIQSLIRRHNDMSQRYALTADGKGQTFRRRSKPKWQMVSYENNATRICFDLIDRKTSMLMPWPVERTVELVMTVRDNSVHRLVESLSDHASEIRQTLIGRTPDGENAGPISARVRIIPLPSIGYEKTNQDIRRLLLEIPGSCPLRADDLIWAFSGQALDLHDRTVDLVPSQTHRQLEHYGIESGSVRHWQTVTPMVLTNASRRRIEPNRKKRDQNDLKGTAEKRYEQEVASTAVRHALRHAGISAKLISLQVQREPFDQRGMRVDLFSEGTRFSKHSLWHVNLELASPILGPLVIGDGRFLGLGLMRPVATPDRVIAFSIDSGLTNNVDPIQLCRALRRAVLSRVGDKTTRKPISPYFTGHQSDGSPAESHENPHLGFAFDPEANRLLVIDPALMNRRTRSRNGKDFRDLEFALMNFNQLRAGKCGLLNLSPIVVDSSSDSLFRASHKWRSVTWYSVNRHAKRSTPEDALRTDAVTECRRRGLPLPIVNILEYRSSSGKHLEGMLELSFEHAVCGPLLLGKTRHFGGGLFAVDDSKKSFAKSP